MTTDYLPALRFRFLTRIYDPLIRVTTRERRFKQVLVDQCNVPSNGTVVDIGCGTGTLAMSIKKAYPDSRVIGLDADPEILDRARVKAKRANVDVEFREANAKKLPLPDAEAHRVVSSLFFHHLQSDDKRIVLSEAIRVLRSDGEMHIADWGAPSNSLMRALFFPVRLLDGFANTQDHVDGRLPNLMADAGAQRVTIEQHINTVFGTLTLFSAAK